MNTIYLVEVYTYDIVFQKCIWSTLELAKKFANGFVDENPTQDDVCTNGFYITVYEMVLDDSITAWEEISYELYYTWNDEKDNWELEE